MEKYKERNYTSVRYGKHKHIMRGLNFDFDNNDIPLVSRYIDNYYYDTSYSFTGFRYIVRNGKI